MQTSPLPNAQSCCPELKMSTTRVDEVLTTWLLYDRTYGKRTPPHSLDFRIDLGLVSLRKLQFSNYSAARFRSCQSPYSLGDTKSIVVYASAKEEASWRGQAARSLRAQQSHSGEPRSHCLLAAENQHHSEGITPRDAWFQEVVSEEKALPAVFSLQEMQNCNSCFCC